MMLVWLSVWSEMQIVCIWYIRCHCHPKPHHLLPHLNPDWYRLIWVVLEKRPLNRCSSSSSSCSSSYICRPDDARHLLVCRTSTVPFYTNNTVYPFLCYKYPYTISLCLTSHPKQLIPLTYSTKESTPTRHCKYQCKNSELIRRMK